MNESKLPNGDIRVLSVGGSVPYMSSERGALPREARMVDVTFSFPSDWSDERFENSLRTTIGNDDAHPCTGEPSKDDRLHQFDLKNARDALLETSKALGVNQASEVLLTGDEMRSLLLATEQPKDDEEYIKCLAAAMDEFFDNKAEYQRFEYSLDGLKDGLRYALSVVRHPKQAEGLKCTDCGEPFPYGLQAVAVEAGVVCRKCWGARNG